MKKTHKIEISKYRNKSSKKSSKVKDKKTKKRKIMPSFISNQIGGRINIKKYTKVIGSGGYGKILSNSEQDTIVKLYYDSKDCTGLQNEYDMQEKAYQSITNYPISQLYVPRQVEYDNEELIYNGESFLCGIEMEQIKPIPLDSITSLSNPMIHIILKKDTAKNQEIGKITTEKISEINPSRGFFASPQWIEENIMVNLSDPQKGEIRSITDLAFRMGFSLCNMVCLAEIYPYDVEYCLGFKNNQLSMNILDFGMAKSINFEEPEDDIVTKIIDGNGKGVVGIYSDIYYPEYNSKYATKFIEGIKNCLENYVKDDTEINKKKIQIMKKIINAEF